MNKEIKRVFIEEGHSTEVDYPLQIKPNFSTLLSIIGILTQGPIIYFSTSDSIRNLIGFNATTLYEDDNLSHNPVDILSFYNFFFETDIAQGMILRGKRSFTINSWTMTVDPG